MIAGLRRLVRQPSAVVALSKRKYRYKFNPQSNLQSYAGSFARIMPSIPGGHPCRPVEREPGYRVNRDAALSP